MHSLTKLSPLGGTQPTDIGMINRRSHRLRLCRWLGAGPPSSRDNTTRLPYSPTLCSGRLPVSRR
jgi:hypothetical protein